MKSPSQPFPHPTSLTAGAGSVAHSPPAEERFVDVEHTTTERTSWHFTLPLPIDSSVVATNTEAPQQGGGPHTLATFASPDGRAQFEVSGTALRDEIDAAEWLEATLDEAGREIVSRKPLQTPAGRVGDVIATWRQGDIDYVGRFFSAKWGDRLFVLACSCSSADYLEFANDFFECLSGFAPLQAPAHTFAEFLHSVDYDTPLPWSAALPTSWDFTRQLPNEDGAYFEAEHGVSDDFDEDSGEIDGRLALAVVPRAVAQRPRHASKLYLDSLRGAGFEITAEDFESEAPLPPFTQCWYMSSRVEREGVQGQLHCRVAMSDHVWLVGGVLGPAREDDLEAWMRNKRALDVACSTISLESGRGEHA